MLKSYFVLMKLTYALRTITTWICFVSHSHNTFVTNEPQITALHNESHKNTHHVAEWWESEKSELLISYKSTLLQRDDAVTFNKAFNVVRDR